MLGAADIIRFVRCGDSSISEFTAFVLPKLYVKTAAVEVKVFWKIFLFGIPQHVY